MNTEVNVLSIITDWLKEHGYDGLVDAGGACGCGTDDLMPCWDFSPCCVPAYRWSCPCELRERKGGELCPEPSDDYARICYRTERQPRPEPQKVFHLVRFPNDAVWHVVEDDYTCCRQYIPRGAIEIIVDSDEWRELANYDYDNICASCMADLPLDGDDM